jgi:hypothetical protein
VGGKSRKTGSVSQALVRRLLKERQAQEGRAGGIGNSGLKKCGTTKKRGVGLNVSVLEVDGEL